MIEQVAYELRDLGFKAKSHKGYVEVTLSNRKPSAMEIDTALGQSFNEINFQVKSTSNSVIVRL